MHALLSCLPINLTLATVTLSEGQLLCPGQSVFITYTAERIKKWSYNDIADAHAVIHVCCAITTACCEMPECSHLTCNASCWHAVQVWGAQDGT